MKKYVVVKTERGPRLDGEWDGPEWRRANTLDVACFREESGDHRPETFFRMLYDARGLYGKFFVRDRYVVSRHTAFNDPVCKDSCVEFFVRPKKDKGYFNFEFNCGGALHSSYIVDETRVDKGFKDYEPLKESDGRQVLVWHSLPVRVEPEVKEPQEWSLAFFIPFDLLEKYAGDLGPVPGSEWRANFYKCADNSSHPHWAAWSPVEKLNFHLPECFGTIIFKDN